MSIQILLNSADVTSQIKQNSLTVKQKITHSVDDASFSFLKTDRKTLDPQYSGEIEIHDGTSKIFGGSVVSVSQSPLTNVDGKNIIVSCVDHTYTMDKILVSRTYEDSTVTEIITDMIDSYAPSFTYANVVSNFNIEKIVFNQVSISSCLKKLANIMNYDWYVDEDKDIHFFDKYENSAPFEINDTNGNFIYNTLKRKFDGREVVNRVKVRGGEYNGELFTDETTVSGNDTKAFVLPYKLANITVELDTGGGYISQDVGIDFIDDFTSDDVLYNYNEKSIKWETALSDGDKIRFSGNPKVPVFAIAEDSESIALYGVTEKLLRDNSISSNEVARKRASAELYVYSEPIVDLTFKTYTPGLRAGMTIRVNSDIQGIDEKLIIKKLTFKMRDHDNFEYKVDLISTRRYDFIALMQKIIEPESKPDDERETSEQIFVDNQIVEVQEEYELVSGQPDEQEIEVQENYELDPFGSNTDAIYVLGPYTPTSQSDTKRQNRLGISFFLY